jgi:hypothetical protein
MWAVLGFSENQGMCAPFFRRECLIWPDPAWYHGHCPVAREGELACLPPRPGVPDPVCQPRCASPGVDVATGTPYTVIIGSCKPPRR